MNSVSNREARRLRRIAALAALLAVLAFPAAAADSLLLRCRWASPNDGKQLDLAFAENPLVVMTPGGMLEAIAEGPGGDAGALITIMKDGRPFRRDHAIGFTAPTDPGAYFIPVVLSMGSLTREAEICVMVPFKSAEKKSSDGCTVLVDGQNIGNYRHPSRSGNAKVLGNPECYEPPSLFIRVTDAVASYAVAPGLPAGELVIASDDGIKHTDLAPVYYPMWIAINTVRQELTARLGIPASAMKLISMFRTPAYNRGVGSNAFGRHIFGDAFDFYIDLDGKGKAADLNRDGKLDRRDAYPVIALVEDLQAEGKIPMGGVGIYNTVGGDHEVTMHVDLRGHRATWGYLYSAGGKRSEFAWASRRFADLDRQEEMEAAARAAKEGRKYQPPRREPLGR